MENDRLVYIDFYRGIGMILVVMGHVYFGSLFNTFIHAFHMPLFFFISGYLYHKEERISYAIQKKAKRFLIPYFTYGFFVVIIYWILYRVDIRNMLFHLFLNNSKDLEAAGGMWFLTASFIVSCFFILIDKFCSRFYLKQCFILLLCVLGLCLNTKYGNNLPWSFVSALVSLVFFDAGYLVKLTEDRIKKRSSALIFIAFILSLFAIFYNGEVNLRIGKFNNIVLFFFNGVVMSIVLLDVCKVFVGSPPAENSICSFLHN